MTVQPATQISLPDLGNIRGTQWIWTAMANGDSGLVIPFDYSGSIDRTIQFEGTFGAGGSVSFQGSNDGVNFHTLRDPFGSALTFSSPDVRQIVEATIYMRPIVTGGDGTTAIVATAFLTRTYR